jgi:hypothetical protein
MLKLSSRAEPYIVMSYKTTIEKDNVTADIVLDGKELKLIIVQAKTIEEKNEIDQFLQVILRLASYPTQIVNLTDENNGEIIFGIRELLKYRILKGKIE